MPGFKRLTDAWLTAMLLMTGCMDFQGYEDPPELTTEVEDWRDEIVYQVMVDRFSNGDRGNDFGVNRGHPARYHGGDWLGLQHKLPYLEELGVTTLWISPVVKNIETDAGVDGYHGYWAQDFTAMNPHFGDLPALRRLVAAAHDRSMKVIIDIVTNHVGQVFYYDINLNGSPDERIQGNGTDTPVEFINEYDPDFDPRGVQAFTSLGEAGRAPVIFQYDPATGHLPPMPELFWNPKSYNRKGRTFDFADEDQLLHGDFPGGLKDVDTTRCSVKQTFVDVYASIIEQTNADGFRIDTIKHVEHEFWRYFTQRIRQRLDAAGKEKFLMFGEAFDGNDPLVGSFTTKIPPEDKELSCAADGPPLTGDQLDSAFYFPQYYTAIRDVFQWGLSTDRIEHLWSVRTTNWGTEPHQLGIGIAPAEIPVNFIDNHDVPRFLWSVGDQAKETRQALLHNALLFLFTVPGLPCLYYGTEQDFDGGNDPANREDLWDSDFATTEATFRWIQRLIRIRKHYASLRRGDLEVTWSTPRTGEEQDAGILAFERNGGTSTNGYSLVIINTHRSKTSRTEYEGSMMQVLAPPGTELRDVFSGDSYEVAEDGTLSVAVEPLQGVLLVPADDYTRMD